MLLIILNILQIFIPYLSPNKLEFPELDQKTFNDLLSTNKSIIAFCVEKSYKEMDPVIRSMNRVASLFSDDKYNVTFVFLGKGIAQEVSYANYLSLPSFFFFKKGKLKCSFAYPKTDSAFIKIVQSLLISTSKSYKQKNNIFQYYNTYDRDSLILRTKNDVLGYLGDCYYTILALPKLYKKAIKVLHQNPRIECDIVLVDEKVLNELDLDNDRLALFRREDNMIVSFSNFSIASVPYYSIINYYAVHDEIRPIFAIASTSSIFDQKYKDLLYELSDKYADFVFGFISSDYYAYINTTVGVNIRSLLHNVPQNNELGSTESKPLDCIALVFNSYKRYTYNISDIFSGTFLSEPFNQEKWLTASKSILNSIRRNERKKHYMSDPIPQLNQNDAIKTVVGLTFDDFVNQKDKDVIILFGQMDSFSGVSLNKTLHLFYNTTKQASSNETGYNYCDEKLSFGIVDISRNSGNFPYFPGIPIIFMYPAKNKSHPIQFRGSPSYDNFLWFLKRYGSFDVPIESQEGPPFSHKQFEQDLMQLLRYTIKMPENEKEEFFEWASEMANLTHTDISKFPGIPKKYCHHHHDHDHKDDDDHHNEYDDL